MYKRQGLVAFAGAELRSGVELVMELVGLEREVARADLVLTGEGRADRQSLGGKVCSGVAGLARRLGVPCVLIAGSVELSEEEIRGMGAVAAHSLRRGPDEPLADSVRQAAARLRELAGRAAKNFAAGGAPVDSTGREE